MKNIFVFMVLSLIFVQSIYAASKIDASICDISQDRQEYESCIIYYKPIENEANKINDEKNKLIADFNSKTSDYSVCWNQVCALGSSDPSDSAKVLKSYADVEKCQKTFCKPILDAYNVKLKKFDALYNEKKSKYEEAICKNCILGYCTYKLDNDCNVLSGMCEKYIGKINYISCGDKDPLNKPLIDPKDVVTEDKPFGEAKNQFLNQQNPITNVLLDKISKMQGFKVVEIQTKGGVVKKILNDVDNSKATFSDKVHYYITDNIKKKFGDKIGEIPVLGPYKDYITKFFDDQKTDMRKTKDTQVQLDVTANAAKQFNMMDGTGDRELKLSPGKNLIPSTTVTKPFEFLFTQLGNGIKKTMANGYKKEYNMALENARLLRNSGSTWSETIKQTINLVGEGSDGSRWVQTLDAQSKNGYKSQEARIKAYIMQMKINGELK